MRAAFAVPDPDFWAGKRVLLTGHTGFKGAWLALWLSRLGANVSGLSLPPAGEPNLFDALGNLRAPGQFADIRDAGVTRDAVCRARPEIVLHLAAQALVLTSYRDPLETFSTNVQGTANVLDAVRAVDGVRVVVAITTDKVYENLEHAYPFREGDALGGHDPYSASKAAAEIVVASYRKAFLSARGVAVATARAGNVIGGGDWSSDRLIPDAVQAWQAGRALDVRRPEAVRPWQHVLDPLAGYLKLVERLWVEPALEGAYNFGPRTYEAATVREVLSIARAAYGSGDIRWGTGADGAHEAGWLALETTKARQVLGVDSRWGLSEAVGRTMAWYRGHAAGEPAEKLCAADIDAFTMAATVSA